MDRSTDSRPVPSGRKFNLLANDVQRHDHAPLPPPPPDESYWAALLLEGDSHVVRAPHDDEDVWDVTFDMVPARGDRAPLDQEMSDWEELRTVFGADQTIGLLVVGYNRGGLLVECEPLRGFVPASQLVDFPSIPDGPSRRTDIGGPCGPTPHAACHRAGRRTKPPDPLRTGCAGPTGHASQRPGQPGAGRRVHRPCNEPVRFRRICRPGRCRRVDPYQRAELGPCEPPT